jgi:membrane associated rhomboid family serine protease
MIPIGTDARQRATPWMNWAIIAVHVLAFMVQSGVPRLDRLALNPLEPSLLTFFTYALLHGSTAHLASNLLFLYIFGNSVNDKMGHIAYLGFYLAACVFAGVGYAATATMPVIGASGAVSAVTGAYICLFPRANVRLLFWLWGIIEIPSVWFIGFFFFQDLFFNFAGEPTGTAHMAHLSGTVFGFLVCSALLYFHLLPRDHFDVVALFKQWNRRRQFRDLTASGYDPFAHSTARRNDPRLPAPRDPREDQIHDIRGEINDALAADNTAKAATLYLRLRKIDPQQVLARQAQLDVANQLASEQLYPQAAEAYELFLRQYRNFEQIEQVELMLGLIYARYLFQYDKARQCLIQAMARLHGERELKLAREELRRVEIEQAIQTKN